MDPTRTTLQLVDRIYDAALDPELWPLFLQDVSAAFGDVAVGLIVQMPQPPFAGQVHFLGFENAALDAYARHFVIDDPLIPHLIRLPEGSFGTLADLGVDLDDYRRSAMFNDWMRPNGLHLPTLGSVVQRDEHGGISTFTAFRTGRARPFRANDLALWGLLVPHLRRALRMINRTWAASAQQRVSEEVLDRLPSGVILLDGRGRVVQMNRRAAEILALRDGLSAVRGELSAVVARDHTELRAAIAQAPGAPAAGVLSVRRPSGRRPFALLVVPLGRSAPDQLRIRAASAVFISDPETECLETDEDVLRRLYGLTRAEARLAALLARGMSLEQAADQLHVGAETVRTHVKRIFSKTDTRRQAELVHLLLSLPSRIRRDP